jgi:hypothetical protein
VLVFPAACFCKLSFTRQSTNFIFIWWSFFNAARCWIAAVRSGRLISAGRCRCRARWGLWVLYSRFTLGMLIRSGNNCLYYRFISIPSCSLVQFAFNAAEPIFNFPIWYLPQLH